MGNPTTAAEFSARTQVLLIGVGQFDNSDSPPLTSSHGAFRLNRALIDRAFCGIPEENVKLLRDSEATLEVAKRELKNLVARSGPETIVFLYLAGHGHQTEVGFVFQCFDTDTRDLPGTGLTSQVLAEELASCKARGVLVIADCCTGAGLAESAPNYSRLWVTGNSLWL